MAKDETFILISLEEEKAKKLAEVISNKTSRKILNYLSEKEASESEIAKDLNIPVSTVHYNIKQLFQNGLIESKEFMWSEKGKKMEIYAPAKKFIVIAPKKIDLLKNQLKTVLPILGFSLFASGIIYFFTSAFTTFGRLNSEAIPDSIQESLRTTVGSESASKLTTAVQIPNFALWFLFGSLFAILIYILIILIRRNGK